MLKFIKGVVYNYKGCYICIHKTIKHKIMKLKDHPWTNEEKTEQCVKKLSKTIKDLKLLGFYIEDRHSSLVVVNSKTLEPCIFQIREL